MRDRKVSRRNFLRTAALTGGALVLASCASPTPTAAPNVEAPATEAQQPTAVPTEAPAVDVQPTSPPAQAGPVTISFWYYWSGIWGDACTAVADNFMKANANIKVEATSTSAEWAKILSAFAAGTPPNVLLDCSQSQLAPRKQLLALDDLIAASSVIKKDNYYPAWWNAYAWQGKQYGVTAGEAGVDLAMIINKGMAKDAGLDINNPPQTIPEMLDWAEKMTKKGSGGVLEQIGFDPLDGTSGQGYYNWAAIYGQNWWDQTSLKFNWQALAEPFKWQAEWINRWGAANFEAFRTGFGGWLEPDSSMALGKQGIHINGYWTPGELVHKAAPGQEFLYTWVPTPPDRKGIRVQTSVPYGVSLPAEIKAQEASFKLLEYMCTDEAGQIFFDTAGGFAWTKSFLAKVDTSKYPGLDFYVKSIGEANEAYSNVSPCPLGFQFPQDRYLEALNKVIYDKKAPEEVLDEAQKACEEELTKLMRG